MADFLSNLVARQLDTEPLVEPRPSWLFEPRPAPEGLGFAFGERTEKEPSSEPNSWMQASRAQPQQIASWEAGPIHISSTFQDTPFLPDAQAPRAISISPETEPLLPVGSRTFNETRTAGAEPIQPPFTAPTSRFEPVPPPSPILESRVIERTIVERPGATIDTFPRVQTIRDGSGVQDALRAERASSQIAVRENERYMAERVPGQPAPGQRVPMTPAEPFAPPLSGPPMPTALPGPMPTIHVTIGRIEVRAALPASPRTRPARPANSGLDDYLRAGGKR